MFGSGSCCCMQAKELFNVREAADGRMTAMRTVAALYVDPRGPYVGLPDVDAWDAARDARRYAGPHPVVAHPPCERWGRYATGGPRADATKPGFQPRKAVGDDGGCFAAALAAVRRWGGVLEHPEASKAWAAHGLTAPPRSGGWVPADMSGGWTCCVEQGHYGHRARKATWLYACHVELPSLIWGPSGQRLVGGEGGTRMLRINADDRGADYERRRRMGVTECLPKSQRHITPPAFRDVLLQMARTARPMVQVFT